VWIFDLPKNIEKEVLIVSFDVEWNIESVAGHTFENVTIVSFDIEWNINGKFQHYLDMESLYG
jgi:hypothetical protein